MLFGISLNTIDIPSRTFEIPSRTFESHGCKIFNIQQYYAIVFVNLAIFFLLINNFKINFWMADML